MSFLHSFILFILFSSVSWGNDITSINLFEPIPYKRDSHFSQYISSKAQVLAGDLLKVNIGDSIKGEIAPFSKDLEKYFPQKNELNNLIESITKDINQNIVKGKLTDDKLISIYSYTGKNLVGKIADRILETEGVKDSARRQLWVNKILEPFNNCISVSLDARYDAKHCMGALTAGLVPNIGSGIVYELSKANLSSSLPESEQTSFNQSQVNTYQTCLKNFSDKPTPKDVNACALSAMKVGVEQVTNTQLDTTIKNSTSSADAAKQIKNEVWPIFDRCIQNIGSSKSAQTQVTIQFFSCIDGLVQNTGIKIVSDKVEHTPALQLSLTGTELKKASSDKSNQFKKCTQDLIAKNIRKNGMIDTAICENAITNDLTYQVTLKKFSQSALEQVKGTNIEVSTLEKKAKSILDSCWKQNQSVEQKENCLRKSIIEFSMAVAEQRLEFSIPASLTTKTQVKKESLISFQACLEENMPQIISSEERLTEKMDPCTSRLLKSATNSVVEQSVDTALNENLGDKDGINLSAERLQIRAQILGNFHNCTLASKDLTPCTDQVTKEATLKIALAAGHASITQEDIKETPKKILSIDEDLKSCTNTQKTGAELSKELDRCKQNFTIEYARVLGIEKFNNTLKGLLGTKALDSSQDHTAVILKKYNDCLDKLYKEYKSVNFCTDQLTRDGELVFKENMNDWMSSGEKDAATLAIKAQFVDFLPCLSGLLPSRGNSETEKVEKDITPLMEIVAKALAQFIEYSPDNAKQDLDELTKQFSQDLHDAASTDVARKNIVDLLYKNGAFDQFLKSYVRKIVGDSFATMPDKDLPKNLKDALITKENFDVIFKSAEGKKVKDAILNQLITPLFVEGKKSSSPDLASKVADITNQVTHLLINSPQFGEKIIASQVQDSMDNISAIKGFFVKVFYGGKNALDWQHVRQTPDGQKAEDYIKENIMTPKFKNIPLTANELKKRNDEAERLVGAAVKSYREPRK